MPTELEGDPGNQNRCDYSEGLGDSVSVTAEVKGTQLRPWGKVRYKPYPLSGSRPPKSKGAVHGFSCLVYTCLFFSYFLILN